jgi:putative transposase
MGYFWLIILGANLKFVSKDIKNLPGDSRKVTLVRDDSASNGKQDQSKNRTSKVIPEKRILSPRFHSIPSLHRLVCTP